VPPSQRRRAPPSVRRDRLPTLLQARGSGAVHASIGPYSYGTLNSTRPVYRSGQPTRTPRTCTHRSTAVRSISNGTPVGVLSLLNLASAKSAKCCSATERPNTSLRIAQAVVPSPRPAPVIAPCKATSVALYPVLRSIGVDCDDERPVRGIQATGVLHCVEHRRHLLCIWRPGRLLEYSALGGVWVHQHQRERWLQRCPVTTPRRSSVTTSSVASKSQRRDRSQSPRGGRGLPRFRRTRPRGTLTDAATAPSLSWSRQSCSAVSTCLVAVAPGARRAGGGGRRPPC
jgi:hypothetical protein